MVDVQRINIKVCSVSIKSLRIRRFSFQIVRLTSFMSLLLPLLSASSWEDTRRLIVMAVTRPEYSQQSLASHHLQLEQVRRPMRQKHEATCCFGRGMMSSTTFILCFYPQNKVKERLSDLSHYKHLSCFSLFHWLLPLPEKQQHFYSCAKMLITKYHFLVRNLITHSVTDVLHKLFL